MTMTEESREVREARAPVWEAEVPWVVAYLREDIQDLRNEVRETRRLTVESYEKLDAKIDELHQDMDVKINGLRQDMDAKIDGLRQDMDAKINGLRQDMDVKINGLRQDMDANTNGLRQDMDANIDGLRQDMDMRFRWTLTTMVAVGALIVAALKLLP
jgi:phosphoglycerate-specific signal transduction histidine kinase